MPALSFQEEWTDKVLRSDKEQTTRPQTDRIKVGDIVHIYNQQRRRITDKSLRRLTAAGCKMVHDRIGGEYPKYGAQYHAHFLGKVKITEVFDTNLSELFGQDREAWAWADGFKDFATARCWFEIRYGARWINQTWTVIRWSGWVERYFEPEE